MRRYDRLHGGAAAEVFEDSDNLRPTGKVHGE